MEFASRINLICTVGNIFYFIFCKYLLNANIFIIQYSILIFFFSRRENCNSCNPEDRQTSPTEQSGALVRQRLCQTQPYIRVKIIVIISSSCLNHNNSRNISIIKYSILFEMKENDLFLNDSGKPQSNSSGVTTCYRK